MTDFVLDASATLACLFDDETNAGDTGAAVLDALVDGVALVPSLWAYEVANGVLMALRRGRITEGQAQDFFADLSLLDIRVDDVPVDPETLFRTGVAAGLTAYDAAYLDLADLHGLCLATADAQLRRAALRSGVLSL